MILQQVLDILAGGPGSGCNPKVGKCGRTKSYGPDLVTKINEFNKKSKLSNNRYHAIPEHWVQFTEISEQSGEGCTPGMCHTNAFKNAKRDKSLKVIGGVSVLKDEVDYGLSNTLYKTFLDLKPYKVKSIHPMIHVWNLDIDGRIVDTTYGYKMAQDYYYFGLEIPKQAATSPVRLDDWIWEQVNKASKRRKR